jgi:lipopolysaccharide export system ATP-binding protein
VVVNGVDLEVPSGEVIGLLGPTVRENDHVYMVVGLCRPDAGQVFLGDEILQAFPCTSGPKGCQLSPQEPSVFRRLTVRENLLAVLESRDMSSEERISMWNIC